MQTNLSRFIRAASPEEKDRVYRDAMHRANAAQRAVVNQQHYGASPMNINYKRIRKNAKEPTYATDGSACMDLYACEDGDTRWPTATGIVLEIPTGYAGMIYSRSGHSNRGVRLANCVGVIDSDYRGEVIVKLTSDRGHPYSFRAGERIAQLMIIPVPQVKMVESEHVSDTVRGDGGFGSTDD